MGPAWEDRPGQQAMATAIEAAIESGRHLVVRAGTGTGKSLAYLVPAILSGRTTVVATATKALQDQLAHKDLPFLTAHLGIPFSFAVLKGRSNYLCLQKVAEVGLGETDERLDLDDPDSAEMGRLGREMAAIVRWGRDTPTGDRADLDFEPRPAAWSRLSVSARECPGASRCPMGEECFAEAARDRAAAADVVVVNSHLYAMHLASGSTLLPPHDAVVMDEAHALEDVVAAALGLEITASRLSALARTCRSVSGQPGAADALEAAAGRLERALAPHLGRAVNPSQDEALAAALAGVAQAVRQSLGEIRAGENEHEGMRARALAAATALADDVALAGGVPEGHVAWVEGPAHAPALEVAPVDVAVILSERLWNEGPTAVLTSATIPPGLGRRLGLGPSDHDDIDVGSPFDFGNQAVLYCASRLPDPRHADYEAAMHDELEALIRAAGGRTLALFTSWRAMRSASEAMSTRLPWRVLTQDEMPKPALLSLFAAEESSCLFATMGFWQGVDVPGAALSLVTIDRIPFPRPDEPLVQARRELAGPRAFALVDLPRAATLLAQGAGRLIRTSTDRGVVAVLDPRLARAGYRGDLLRSLPPMRLTALRANVEAFLSTPADGTPPRSSPVSTPAGRGRGGDAASSGRP